MKLIQPPYSIVGFRNCFCLLQSKQNFVKSSHFWACLHSVHLRNKTKTKRFSSYCSKQICRGVETPKMIQRFYLFRSCENNIALELEQVTHHIFGRKKLKNYLMCKSNVIWTLHLFYRHNAT